MKCPKCGFVSFNYLDSCKRCGMDLSDYKKRMGISAEPTSPPRKKPAPIKPAPPKKSPEIIKGTAATQSESAPAAMPPSEPAPAPAQQTDLFSPQSEKDARVEARKIREQIEREARQRAERIQRKIEEEAHAQALQIRILREREAKEEAEKIRKQIEDEALARAEKMREEIERDARARAEHIRRETEQLAKKEAEKIRYESEREAMAIAQEIRRKTEEEAWKNAEQIKLRFEREALSRSEELKKESESEAKRLAETILDKSEREAKSEISSLRETAMREAEKLKQEALAEALELKKEAEKVARETIEKAFAEARRERESWFDGRLPAEEKHDWVAPDPNEGVKDSPGDEDSEIEQTEEEELEESEKPPADHPEWAKTKESAAQEKSRMKNIPTAGDYLHLLAKKADKAPAADDKQKDLPVVRAWSEAKKDQDQGAARSSAESFAEKDAPPKAVEGASTDEVMEEEVIEIEDDAAKGEHEKPRFFGMGGLIMRGMGGLVDAGILTVILALFVLIGKVAFSVAGQTAGWTHFLRLSGPIYALFFMIATGYFTIFIGGAGQTPAMMLFGLKVVSKRGEVIGYNLAFLRHGLCLLSLLFLGLGFWGIPLNRNKQGWHDKLTQSVVIRV